MIILSMALHIMVALGFPLWLRLTHFINILFIGLLIRSGIQILGAHPRLYWRDDCNPRHAWLTLTRRKIPRDKLYTSMDDEIAVSPLLAQPGKDNLGLGRLWHFFCVLFWLLNGVIYIVLLFATGEWARLIPTSWDIVPRAGQTLLTYLSLHSPPASDFQPYDPLQQLTYAGVVFLLAPFMLITGAAMSPAIEARFPWYLKLLGGKQGARSLHFLSMLAFVVFIIIHTVLVVLVHFQDNIRNIVLGSAQTDLSLAIVIAGLAILFILGVYIWASWYTLRRKRRVQHLLSTVVDPVVRTLLHQETSRQEYQESDRSDYFWVNGRPPVEETFKQIEEAGFRNWRLQVLGLVEKPREFSLEELKAMPKQIQTTKHNCIQGWSGIAEWGGAPVSVILDLCQVQEEGAYLVFTSYQRGAQSYPKGPAESLEEPFYEILDLQQARHPQTILAYEMNGKELPLEHGAPLRLRAETLLGYKMVKYLRSIEVIHDYKSYGKGLGGYREEVQFYGRGAEI